MVVDSVSAVRKLTGVPARAARVAGSQSATLPATTRLKLIGYQTEGGNSL